MKRTSGCRATKLEQNLRQKEQTVESLPHTLPALVDRREARNDYVLKKNGTSPFNKTYDNETFGELLGF
jgi:hypothetical protein